MSIKQGNQYNGLGTASETQKALGTWQCHCILWYIFISVAASFARYPRGQ